MSRHPHAVLALVALVFMFSPVSADELAQDDGYLGISLDGTRLALVVPGSPAFLGGLRTGDVLLAIDGRNVTGLQDVRDALKGKTAGKKIQVRYRRGSEERTCTVTLGRRKASPSPFPGGTPKMLDTPAHYEREGVPLSVPESLTAGLRWLVTQQTESGLLPAGECFPGYRERFHVAVTSIGGMALMLDPAFDAAASRALEFVLAAVHDDGYIYHERPSFKGMWEHGFATQFLAEMLIRRRARGEDTASLERPLRRAVALIERVQNLDGGWGYRAMPDPHAEVGPGAAMLDALLLARRAAIPVRKNTIELALRSQCALMLPPRAETTQGEWRSFSYEANAFTAASLLGWKDRPDTQVYLEALGQVSPETYLSSFTESTRMQGVYWATGNHTLGLFYTALAYRRLGKSRAGEFATWHEQVAAGLTRMQRDDGAFKGWFGDVYGTAFACLTLGARTGKLAQFTAGGEPDATASLDLEGTPTPVLRGPAKVKIGAFLSAARTRHAWQGVDKTVSSVGLRQGASEWTPEDLQLLLPGSPVAKGRAWTVSKMAVQKLFSPLGNHVRGIMQARAGHVRDGILEVNLRALVKFGEATAKHVQTTSFTGSLRIDVPQGQLLSLALDTVSGCIRVRRGRGSYVALNDIRLRLVSGETPPETAEDRPVVEPAQEGPLFVGGVDAKEPTATTPEEKRLCLKAHPSISQKRPFWLYVPPGLPADAKPPLVIVLHRRGRLRSFSTGMAFDATHLEAYATPELAAWKKIAAHEKFVLLLPLGEPDILWMGMSWRTGDRTRLVHALQTEASKLHAFDRSRVYLVGMGEGGHAAMATTVRGGDAIAATAACNPPLFTGESMKGNVFYPETTTDMVGHAGTRKAPLLVLAGDRDKELKIHTHRNYAVKQVRYQDSSRIPAEQLKTAADVLVTAGFPLTFRTIATRHYAPLPDVEVEAVWRWLSKHRIAGTGAK